MTNTAAIETALSPLTTGLPRFARTGLLVRGEQLLARAADSRDHGVNVNPEDERVAQALCKAGLLRDGCARTANGKAHLTLSGPYFAV